MSMEADCGFLQSDAFRKFHVGWRVCVSASQLWIRREPQHDTRRYYDTIYIHIYIYTPEIEDGRRAYPTVRESTVKLPKLEMHIRRCVSLVTKRWSSEEGRWGKERKGHVFLVPGILKGGRTKQRHDMIWVCPPKNANTCTYHIFI